MGNEALARQLLHYAEGSLILGATVIAYVIMRQLIQRLKGILENIKTNHWGLIMRRFSILSSYLDLKNFVFGAPHIGHFSGGSPSTVFPQTPQME